LPLVTRAIDRLRGWVQRTPYDTNTGLALNAILGSASVNPERRFVSMVAEPSQTTVRHAPGESALN
jgi:hypothetical protein